MKGKSWRRRCTDLYLITARQREWANATTDKIVSVVHGNCDFDPIRFRAKIAIFDFDSIIVTSLSTMKEACNNNNNNNNNSA